MNTKIIKKIIINALIKFFAQSLKIHFSFPILVTSLQNKAREVSRLNTSPPSLATLGFPRCFVCANKNDHLTGGLRY